MKLNLWPNWRRELPVGVAVILAVAAFVCVLAFNLASGKP